MKHILKGLVALAGAVVALGAQAHSGHGEHAHHSHEHSHAASQGHGSHTYPDPDSVATPAGVAVSGCWIRALPNRLPAAAYFRLQNTGSADVKLIGAQAEGFGKVMLHTHKETNGMTAMAHVDQVVVPAGGSFDFSPRGHHVMLEQATVDLKVGSQHPLVLWFEGPQALTVSCDVRPPATLQ